MPEGINRQVEYLIKITDKIGVIEHSNVNTPNYSEGYCVDDNARALQVAIRLGDQYPGLQKVKTVYFDFLKSAVSDNGCHNDLNSDLTWKKDSSRHGEHFGRAISALGELSKSDNVLAPEAIQTFDRLYSNNVDSRHVRVWSQIILGLKDRQSYRDIKQWADLIVEAYSKEKSADWRWFEDSLSYDNGRPVMGLLAAYQVTGNSRYLKVGLDALEFLTSTIFIKDKDYFIFPGNKGWINRDGSKAIFDQQPIEAGSMTECYSLAYCLSKNVVYKKLAQKAFDWYKGKNNLAISLVDPVTGGIYDGLTATGVNRNQGAEAVLSYLLGWTALKK